MEYRIHKYTIAKDFTAIGIIIGMTILGIYACHETNKPLKEYHKPSQLEIKTNQWRME